MEFKIEKMNRMRKNILFCVLIGTVIALVWFMLPTFFVKYRFANNKASLIGAGITASLTFLLFVTRYWLYKRKLKRDPSLRAAVNDERIRLNWLRAYRFAFLVVIGVTIFWKLRETSFLLESLAWKMFVPHGPWLIVFGAIISLVGSFLFYNREA